MVQHDRRTALGIDMGCDAVADGDAPRGHRTEVAESRAELLRVADREAGRAGTKLAGIADLAAALRIERCAFEHDGTRGALFERLHGLGLRVEESHDGRITLERVVTEELRRAVEPDAGGQIGAELARGLRLLSLHGHGAFVAFDVDGEPPLTRDVGREIGRKPVGVVELEDRVAVDDFGATDFGDGRVQNPHAVLERARELLALFEKHLPNERLPRNQLGIGRAHHLRKRGHQVGEKRGAHAELVAVPHGTARDAAQHVAAALVRGNHAVDDEETARADVVRDHAQRRVLQVAGAEQACSFADQVDKEIDVVVVRDALHDRGHALEARTRIHRRLRQRRELAVGRAVVLHEDQVPDLDPAIAIGIG